MNAWKLWGSVIWIGTIANGTSKYNKWRYEGIGQRVEPCMLMPMAALKGTLYGLTTPVSVPIALGLWAVKGINPFDPTSL